MGELLRMVEKSKGGGDSTTGSTAAPSGRKQAAEAAGIGWSQARRAMAMSRVPEKKREELLERDRRDAIEKSANGLRGSPLRRP